VFSHTVLPNVDGVIINHREEARKRIEAIGETFKLEVLDSIKTEPITIYHIGDVSYHLQHF
jgi:threonyl-tRNA synthetase